MYPSSQVRWVALRAVIVAAALSGTVLWQASSALGVTPPANDNLTNATFLSTSGTYHAQSSESTAGATTESGEPINNNLGGATVWYVWQAPDYPVNVTATTAAYTDVYGSQLQTASNFDTVLNVYQDATGLPLVGGNDDSVGLQSVVTFSTQPNQAYLFQIGGFGSATGNLNFLIATQPANDNFANTTTLSGVSTQTNTDGTLYGATAESGEFGGFFQPPSVWYAYTPAKDGELTANLVNTGSQTVMDLWTGSAIGSLTFVAGDSASLTRVPLTAGVTYHIEVFGPTDAFTLQWRYDPFPDNNDFANAQVISGTSGNFNGTTYGADLQSGEPKDFTFQCCSVWYAWTAPESGWVTPSITSPNNDVSLDIYQGPDLLHLSVPAINGSGAFHATQGQTYYFQAITAIRDTFSASWSEAASPSNDDFANATVITKTDGSPGDLSGDLRQASIESGEPNVSSQYVSVWYSWTPSVNGDSSISIGAPNTVAVYTGSSLNALSTVGGPQTDVDFRAVKGTTYMIQAIAPASNETAFDDLFVDLSPAPANDNFADASAFDMGLGTVDDVSGTLAHASSEQGEPNADGQLTVWYYWTPTYSGASDIEVVSGSAQVAVYTGPDLNLAHLAELVGPTDSAQWAASAGHLYWIQVSMPGPPGTTFGLQTREAESDLHTTTTGPASGSVGAQLTYSSTVTNSGPQPTTVKFDLSPSFPVRLNSFTSAASCAGTGGGALSCSKLLASGASFSVKYRIGAPVAGTLTVTGVPSSVDGNADPTPGDDNSSASTLVKTVATTRYTGVTDDGFTVATLNIGAVGNTVFWNNLGPSGNEVQDASGLGLFDLHLGAPVDFGSFQYWASGKYLVQSPPDDTTQTITVPIKHSPATGGISTSFVLTWAAFQAPTGYQYELDIKRPGTTLWQDWQTTGLKSGSFTPDRGTGTYQFRMRLFKPGTLLASGWVTTSIVVS